jgi:hypothetical protein
MRYREESLMAQDPRRFEMEKVVGDVPRRVGDVESALLARLGSSAGSMFNVAEQPYNAKGDGTTDDAGAIQAAVTAASALPYGGVVYLPPGDYVVNSIITCTISRVMIQGAGPGVTRILHGVTGSRGTASTAAVFKFTGTVPAYASPTATLTANVAPSQSQADYDNGRTLSVNALGGIAAGDVILVGDSYADTFADSGWANRRRGELVRVASATGNTITLRTSVRDSYTTARSAAVWKPTFLTGNAVKDLTIRGRLPLGTGYTPGLYFFACRGVRVENVYLENLDSSGIVFARVYDGRIDGCTVQDLADEVSEEGARLGYGVVLGNAESVVIDGCRFYRCRHGVTTSGTSGHVGYTRNVLVAGCLASETTNTGFDTHPWTSDVSFIGCRAERTLGPGYNIRSERTRLLQCESLLAKGGGIAVQLKQAIDVEIANCRVIKPSAHGIYFSGNITDGYPARVTIRENYIEQPYMLGILVRVPVVGLRIIHNVFSSPETGSPTRRAIHLDSAAAVDGAWFISNVAYNANVVVSTGGATQVNLVLTGNRLLAAIGADPAAVKGSALTVASNVVVDNLWTNEPTLTTRTAGDVVDRLQVDNTGVVHWSDGTTAADTNLYRNSADVLKTDDALVVADALIIKTKAGAITDGDFLHTPPNGAIAIDTKNSKIYVRIGGVWKATTALA